VNDGSQKPPGYGAQQPWMAQGPTQPWAPPQPGFGAPPQPGYGPPPQPGYGPPAGYEPPPPQNPYAAPYAQPGMAMPQEASLFGDAAGEHLRMTRGRYGATVYVVFAFLMQIGIVTGAFALLAALISGVGQFNDDATALVMLVSLGTGLLGGSVLSYFVFRDRWKCIEAFSSRFCSGLMNLSLMYVPFIALVYANVRGVQKLSGR
jgi:hypothetical protein